MLISRKKSQIDFIIACRKFLIRGTLTEEEYQQEIKELQREQISIRDNINGLHQREDKWQELTERTFQFASKAKTVFNNGTIDEKRNILTVFLSNLTITDKKLDIALKEPFKLIADHNRQIRIIEPPESLDTKRLEAMFACESPSWLG